MKINEIVAEKIAKSGPTVLDAVVTKLAEVEINKRIEIVTEANGRLGSLQKNLKKVNNPDNTTYNAEMQEVKGYSAGRMKEINDNNNAIKEVETLLNACLEKNLADDYEKLKNAIAKSANIGGSKDNSAPKA